MKTKSRWQRFLCWLKTGHDYDTVGMGAEQCKLCGKIRYDWD